MKLNDQHIEELLESHRLLGIIIKKETYFRENRRYYLSFLKSYGFLENRNITPNNTINNVFSMNVIQRKIASYL